MKNHEELEAISAYVDGEVDAGERARIEAHLDECEFCSATLSSLEIAVRAVAALPEITPAPDQTRSLRLRLLESFEPRRPRAWLASIWAAAGGLAVLIIAVVGFNLMSRPEVSPPNQAVKSGPATELPPLEFSSEDEVRDIVAAQSEVTEAKGRWRVSDVGEEQDKAVRALSFTTSTEGRTDDSFTEQTAASRSAEGAQTAPRSAGRAEAPALEKPVGECLRTTLRTQPYPMMPVSARPAFFKRQPVWLLVYAWTSSSKPDAPLDRLQIWLVTRTDCAPVIFQQLRLSTG